MAGMCCGVVGETETPSTVEPSGARQVRRRPMEIHQLKFLGAAAAPDVLAPLLPESSNKRRKTENENIVCEKVVQKYNKDPKEEGHQVGCLLDTSQAVMSSCKSYMCMNENEARFGVTTVCGRRRDMEDAVAVKPSFVKDVNFYGVYDGHGCSHVAMKCKDRMHEIVKDEMEKTESESFDWKESMAVSFTRMDKEVTEWSEGEGEGSGLSFSNCRCELQTPQCDAVGSTAVVAVVTPNKIIVSNCGDSRAVLCRNGVAIPLSVDHKPDRPDELARIEAAGGRVIYWDGARVLGVLAMSRAIGDNYLKPYVIPEPEVTVTDRTGEDECLILASDGLWDVVSNDVACSVARMCLTSQKPPSHLRSSSSNDVCIAGGESSDKACSDASILLTKLALARQTSDNVSVVVVDLRRNQ